LYFTGLSSVDVTWEWASSDRLAIGLLLGGIPAGRHGEVGERRSGAFDGVTVDTPTLDAALQDSVPDARSAQLHDHIRRTGQQRNPGDTVLEQRGPGRTLEKTAVGRRARGLADRAVHHTDGCCFADHEAPWRNLETSVSRYCARPAADVKMTR
jgi:hypothetical protein